MGLLLDSMRDFFGFYYKRCAKPSINRYLSRVTPPSIARTAVINGGPDIQSELEFRCVGFCGGRKTGEKTLEQGENQQQTQAT